VQPRAQVDGSVVNALLVGLRPQIEGVAGATGTVGNGVIQGTFQGSIEAPG
jgi:hypothetical protein